MFGADHRKSQKIGLWKSTNKLYSGNIIIYRNLGTELRFNFIFNLHSNCEEHEIVFSSKLKGSVFIELANQNKVTYDFYGLSKFQRRLSQLFSQIVSLIFEMLFILSCQILI